jgi:hypothetical protein
LSDTAIRFQRDQRCHAKFRQLLDKPFLAIALRQRDADRKRERQLAIDFNAIQDPQLDLCPPEILNHRTELGSAVIEERYCVSDRCPHHVQQVVRFGPIQYHAICRNRGGRVKAV